jgi:tricorn protease
VPGYYRFPTLHGDRVVFVSEDDLWEASLSGGTARRLTSGLGPASHPAFSPDGAWIALSSQEEGHQEIYLMPSHGGPPKRLTYLGGISRVVGWQGSAILFVSNAAQPHPMPYFPYRLEPGGLPEALPLGPADGLSYGPRGIALVRHQDDIARWKRYRGGTAGELWVDPEGTGEFRHLELPGNLARPMWIGERIYFVADPEGVGNLYSCTPEGEDLRRHTHHEEFYVRFPSTDGQRIVYSCGAELYLFDPQTEQSRRLEIDDASPRHQRSRRFVSAATYLEDYSYRPDELALACRGQVFRLGWEGGALRQGSPPGRRRLPRWLPDGRLLLVSDASGQEALEIYGEKTEVLKLDLGRVVALKPAPQGTAVALTNHRNELLWIDLATGALRVLDRSPYSPILGLDWSPDGAWIAYGLSETPHTSRIRLVNLSDFSLHSATRPVLRDLEPRFDPLGRYLYFLSYRVFDPVYDQLHFEAGFPKGMRPYALALQEGLGSPLGIQAASKGEGIDLDGLEERILSLPVPEGIYRSLEALPNQLFLLSWPLEGALQKQGEGDFPAKGSLEVLDFTTGKLETWLSEISEMRLEGGKLLYRAGTKFRVIPPEQPKEEAKETPGRQSGWVDLNRIPLEIHPAEEWAQMLRETWRLQQEQFWQDRPGIDWEGMFTRYAPLLERVGSRSELSDLIWELQGELGTSHAYESGGDQREPPHYEMGFLGADFRLEDGRWRFERILPGDPWDEAASSPLARAGSRVTPGSTLLAINGIPLEANLPPSALLLRQAGAEVTLSVGDTQGNNPKELRVKTLKSETPLRYRTWVESCRRFVHQKSQGRVGYLHIPNMQAWGLSEFHRGFLGEIDREGLIVDVRYNGGGNVSWLLLEKLLRRPLAHVRTRWFGTQTYPEDTPQGPLVILTNEYAGSDGDIFCQIAKQLQLAPLIGKRTWGGVIGIWPRHPLADRTRVTQPEFAFWFPEIGLGIENRGVEPDIPVDNRPQDWAAGRDHQLEVALEELLKRLGGAHPA